MQIDWQWQFVLLLTLSVVGYSCKQDLDQKTEDSLEVEMCKKEDIASQLGLHGDLGFGWHLVREGEREGRSPGTREKVEEFLLKTETKEKTEKYKIGN